MFYSTGTHPNFERVTGYPFDTYHNLLRGDLHTKATFKHGVRSCECNRRGKRAKLCRLCLSLISSVVYLLSLFEFLLHYPSACSAAQCFSWYIDVTIAFPWVPIRNFTAWIITRQRVSGYPGTRCCLQS